jgi:hypothetical protein
MSESTALAVAGTSLIAGKEMYRASTDAASLCKAVVLETAMTIQGRKYVKVEGWQSIAIAHGCVASAESVERVNDPACPGYRAIGSVKRMDTGATIATAEGFVGDDESTWAKRPVYAKRAMAQTRAISRACRSAFAHVVVMMNAGLSTTPAEEVPQEGFDDAPAPKHAPPANVKAASEVLEGEIVEPSESNDVAARRIYMPAAASSPNRGKFIGDKSIPKKDLQYWQKRLTVEAKDPKDKEKLAALNDALAQGLHA